MFIWTGKICSSVKAHSGTFAIEKLNENGVDVDHDDDDDDGTMREKSQNSQ